MKSTIPIKKVDIDFHNVFLLPSSHVWFPTFFKISSFVFDSCKKFVQVYVWNNLRVSKQFSDFLVNYLFNNLNYIFSGFWNVP